MRAERIALISPSVISSSLNVAAACSEMRHGIAVECFGAESPHAPTGRRSQYRLIYGGGERVDSSG